MKHLELEAKEPRPTLYIETGETLRGFVKTDGYTPQIASTYLAKGGLLPSFLPIYLWVDALVEGFSGKEHVVLDGTARRIEEASILDSALQFYDRADYHVFVLDLDDEVALARLRDRARGDDRGNDEGMLSKIAWYREHVVPCIQYFEKNGKRVHHLDGARSIEAIHAEILSILGLA